MVLETHMNLCMTEPDFPEKRFWPQNWENRHKIGQSDCRIFKSITSSEQIDETASFFSW